MSVEYSAIAAKLKAMYSKFLTRDEVILKVHPATVKFLNR